MKVQRVTRFDVLVCYDVNTTEADGRKRLRKVAKACEGYGQRVQNSVFECTLSDALLEKLRAKLLDIIDREQDNLRIYFLYGARETRIEAYGRDTWIDMSGPLIA